MYVLGAQCISCDKEWQLSEINYCCPNCHGNLDICYDYKKLKKQCSRSYFNNHQQYSIWRYLPLLPLQRTPRISLQLGWTPLYSCGLPHGVRLYLKDEGRNPSGSLKDRASAIVLGMAQENNRPQVSTASTGNAGSSLACLAANLGIPTTVFLPRNAPEAKIAQLAIFGARLFLVNGNYDDAYDLCLKASEQWGWYNRNTGYNPFTREGKKTCAYEICEQLDWNVPDWVLVSVGDGNTISGLWKGFQDLYNLGLIERLPRLAGVQSTLSNAIARTVQSFRDGKAIPVMQVKASTIADSISVDLPRDGDMAVKAILASQGEAVEVSDDEILEGIRTVAQTWGIFGEPAAVASYVGFEKLCEHNQIRPGEVAVCVITGNGLKDIAAATKASHVSNIATVEPEIRI